MTVISRLLRQAPGTATEPQPSAATAGPALHGADEALRLAAIERLEAGEELYTLAGLNGAVAATGGVQRAAQYRIAQLIETGAIADDALLARLALAGATPAIRQLAAERVQDAAALQQLLKDARGKDKNVYRIVKHKRDAWHAQRRAAEAELLAMYTLCNSIERHILQPCNNTYVAAVEHLAAQWQAVAAGAPPELNARAQAALERSREIIARYQQQIAEQAARIAAIGGAAAERQAILAALRTLLAGLYAAPPADPAEAMAAHGERWNRLSKLEAPTPEELARYQQLRAAITALAAETAQHGAVTQLSTQLSGEPGERSSQALRRALTHASLLGEELPAEARDAAAALQAWEQARAEQQAAAAAALRQAGALLRRAQSSLAAGNSRQAAGMRRALESKLAALGKLPLHLSAQLQSFDAQLGVLQDWRSFVVAPKRTELITQMEALIDCGDAPRALADRIKRLQDEWKLVSKGSTEDTQAEWQRFHAAAQLAYEPCREYFAAQARQRDDNLERRRALLVRLQDFAAAQQGEAADWREVGRALRESAQQWRRLQPVERAANKPLQESFDAVSAALQARLEAAYAGNAEAKRALIARAQRLLTMEDGRQATEDVKRLQLAWQAIGPVSQDESQRLWEEFRQHCDAVFARRQQQHSEYQASLEANRAQAIALCEQAEQILALSGPELIEGVKRLAPLREAFAALGELPVAQARAIYGRFERLQDQCQQKLTQLRAQGKLKAWEHVLEAADLIRRQRLGVAEGAAAEEYLASDRQWPKGALAALRSALAQPGSTDIAANEAALRLLCIRAELLTDTPSPAGDQALRREYQLQQLLKGLGQARAEVNVALEALVFEWLAVGATGDAVYAGLLERFNACRRARGRNDR